MSPDRSLYDLSAIANFLSGVTDKHQIYDQLGKIIINFFNADLVAWIELTPNDKLNVQQWDFSNRIALDKNLTTEMTDLLDEVFKDGILFSQNITAPFHLALAFLPIISKNQVVAVVMVGHANLQKISDHLIDRYRNLSVLVGNTIEIGLKKEEPKGHSALFLDDSSIPDLSDKQILIVEDNLINQELVKEFLSCTNCRMKIANNGLEATKFTDEHDFDLILMDIHMPVMDGLEATRYIRRHEAKKNIIIALTAAVFKEDYLKAMAAGMDDQINKPIIPKLFFIKLATWLNSSKSCANDSSHSNNIILKIDGMDYQANLDRMMQNQELVNAMLIKFSQNHANDAESIKTAMEAYAINDAKRIAHTMKGTAGMLDAEPLRNAATHLELALINSPTSYDPELIEFEYQLLRLISSIKSYFKL